MDGTAWLRISYAPSPRQWVSALLVAGQIPPPLRFGGMTRKKGGCELNRSSVSKNISLKTERDPLWGVIASQNHQSKKKIMTRITLLIALLLIGSMRAISQKEKKAESKIEQVTVFLQGAQIKEKGKFTADKGVTKIIFEGMAPAYNQQSIQVKGKGEFIILDVSP
ncbi:MAG: DUF4140 domain-containing protein, partial [Flavobacteriales bacterium]